MRAGRGIVHSERTSPERKHTGQRLFGIQSWMALPEAEEESDPAFVHHGEQELPIVEVDGIRARVIAGEVLGARSPLITPSETVYAHLHLRAGARMPIEPSFDERAVYTLAGEIEVAGDAFGPGQLLVLRAGDPIVVKATTGAEFMLFGGAPMGGPRYIWWNFVSSRLERIQQAREEWAQGRFDTVPGDAEEFIPLPDTKDSPRRATGAVFYP
jgi:redox-sensitive bicupin YhaK (pirin superfamily)